MNLYGSGGIYGSGLIYGLSNTDIPQSLAFYRTSQDGIYTFYWTFVSSFISPVLQYLDFELQLDTVPTFDSPNLVDFGSVIVKDTTNTSLPPFIITEIVDGTHLIVSTTIGLNIGDTISQSFTASSAIITAIPDTTHLTVTSTSGFLVSNVITYQNGNVWKGFAVPVAPRLYQITQTWYAQVRTVSGNSASAWSSPLTWTIPVSMQQQYAENLMNSLPDSHVYGKADLLKPVNQRDSNLYLVENMYGNQLDAVFYENFLTANDNSIELCRDEFLFQNFGVSFNFPKPTTMQYVDYRGILTGMINASLIGSTNGAIEAVVEAFTGVAPILTNPRDEEDFFLDTVLDDPITSVSGQTFFPTAFSFIPGSLTVEQLPTLTVANTAGFIVGQVLDSTTNVSFLIISIISSTEIGISNVPYISSVRQLNPGDTIKQGVAVTTISSVTEGGLVSSGSYIPDPIVYSFTCYIISIPDGTHFAVNTTIGMNIGNIIKQGSHSTSIISIIDDSHIQVGSTTGFVTSSATVYEANCGGWTMTSVPSAGTIFQATYDIGKTGDPVPVVFDPLESVALTGTITFTNGDAVVSGTGTLFTIELNTSDKNTLIDGTGYFAVIDSIQNNTTLTLTEAWPGPTETVAAMRDLYSVTTVTPPILWDKATLAFGIIIEILNPGHFNLNESSIEMLVGLILPSFVKVFFEFPTN